MKTIQIVLRKVEDVEKPVSTREWIVGLGGASLCYGFILLAV